jgi:hypothetical protein
MHRIEYDHALGNVSGVIAKLATLRIAAPDSKGSRIHLHNACSSVSGERTLVACWRARPRDRELFKERGTSRKQ